MLEDTYVWFSSFISRVLVSGLSKRPGVRMLTLLIPAPTPDCRRLQLCCLSLIPSEFPSSLPFCSCAGVRRLVYTGFTVCSLILLVRIVFTFVATPNRTAAVGIQATEHQSHIDQNCFIMLYRSKIL